MVALRSFRPRRIQGTRVRCIIPGHPVISSSASCQLANAELEFIELNEIGVVDRVLRGPLPGGAGVGDLLIITFEDHEKHPFPVKLPRTHVEPADKFKGENE